jgi:hypothetical protein
MKIHPTRTLAVVTLGSLLAVTAAADESSLLGHWPLAGDTKDASGRGHHATNHGADLTTLGPGGKADGAARFDGRDDYLEVADSRSLRLGTGDFSVAVWVHTDKDLDDVLGDLIAKFDPASRKGFTLTITNNVGVTSSQSNYRHVHFGIDNGRVGTWTDCGRLGRAVLVYTLAVYDGHLYAGTCEAGKDEAGHVFRYEGGTKWVDCGSPDRCNTVSALAVYQGKLYAGVSRYRLGGSALPDSENRHLGGKVYRYEGGQRWVECGQLAGVEAVNGLVVYRGRLYASSMYSPGLFRYDGGTTWTSQGSPNGKRVEALAVYNGHLYATGYDEGAVYRFDGDTWTHCGRLGDNTQTYSFAIHHGQMYVGTWPSGKVFRYAGDHHWVDAGRLGEELEVMGMAVYNGKLYAGTLPLAEVYRYDGGTTWTRAGRLDHTPDVKYRRAWSMAVFQGKLFAGTLPSGHVHSLEAGKSATSDRELSPGWNHLAAVKGGDRLRLYVNGQLVATSSPFNPAEYDLSNDKPLTIGFGPHDYFNGRMRDLRLYGRALSAAEVEQLARRP